MDGEASAETTAQVIKNKDWQEGYLAELTDEIIRVVDSSAGDIQQFLKESAGNRNPRFTPKRLLPELSEDQLDLARKFVKPIEAKQEAASENPKQDQAQTEVVVE